MADENDQHPPTPASDDASSPPPIEGAPVVPPRPAEVPPNPYANAATPPPPYGPPPSYVPQPYGTSPAGPPRGLSIASMVLGIAGVVLVCCYIGGLIGILAVVLGHLAQKREPHGRPMWITGLITGYIAAGLGLLLFLVQIVIGFLPLFMLPLVG